MAGSGADAEVRAVEVWNEVKIGARGAKLSKRKLNMDCRVEGCKNRSGGPRTRFMCVDHQKLPKNLGEVEREAGGLRCD